MESVIGVRFKKPGKMYYFDPAGMDIRVGDTLVLETSRGMEMGECVTVGVEIDPETLESPLRKVVRLATEADINRVEANRENERAAYDICQEKILHHKLEMKLVDVEYAFDNSKIIFYFTANGRVDFRALVKDLASAFKTRIELRQIGVRDEAKMLGGLGPCGRPICCGTFLSDFEPVSIKMAKEQNLSLNPIKISGLCGRLMCCLKYEEEAYEQGRKTLPRVGKEVMTPEGPAHVMDVNVLKQTVRVRITKGDESEVREFKGEEVERINSQEGTRADEEPEETAEDAIGEAECAELLDRESEQLPKESEEQKEEIQRAPEENDRRQHQYRPGEGGKRRPFRRGPRKPFSNGVPEEEGQNQQKKPQHPRQEQ